MLSGRADEENAALTTEIGMAEVKASWKGDQLRHIMKTKGGTLDLPHLQWTIIDETIERIWTRGISQGMQTDTKTSGMMTNDIQTGCTGPAVTLRTEGMMTEAKDGDLPLTEVPCVMIERLYENSNDPC